MNLPKTDDNDRAHRGYANILPLHIMMNVSFWASASQKQVRSFVLKSQQQFVLSNVLGEENNLPPVTD